MVMVCTDKFTHKVGDEIRPGFYMDSLLKTNLDKAKELINKDWDMIILVDGYEGSGKSVLAMQAAYYCDNSLTLDRITFNANTFRKAVLSAKPFQAVVYDEAYTGLSSRSAMGRINRALVTMLAEIRQKNLFVFVVMPTYFDLDKYVALWRSRALINVYVDKDHNRGYFAFYNMNLKKQMFVEGKKFYNYMVTNPNFRGRFLDFYVLDEKKYREAKKNALNIREADRASEEVKKEMEAELFIRLVENEAITDEQKYKILGMPKATFYYKLRNYRAEKAEFAT